MRRRTGRNVDDAGAAWRCRGISRNAEGLPARVQVQPDLRCGYRCARWRHRQRSPGVYRGGFTIDKNLSVNGAGAGRTIVSGGGPVITVGVLDAADEPTVAIDGVTITAASPIPRCLPHEPYAVGGGVSFRRRRTTLWDRRHAASHAQRDHRQPRRPGFICRLRVSRAGPAANACTRTLAVEDWTAGAT